MAHSILVVDDDPDVVRLITVALKSLGNEVASAANGAGALLAVDANRPDLIILDITMPILDGFQTLSLLREKQETASIPVIMLTASKREMDVVTGWSKGIDFYLTKPFDMQELITVVKRVLEAEETEAV